MFNDFDQEIKTDQQGYLIDPKVWNTKLAEVIACRDGIQLTADHWLIIHFLRDFYQKFNTYPAVRLLVELLKQHHGVEKGNSHYLYKLFPLGPALQASKIAGLPKPVTCI